MATVTNIKQQQKRTDRFAIYVDGKYSFSLGEVELLRSKLRLNQELSTKELDDLKDTARYDKAYDQLLNYISLRRRSEGELRDYLKRKKQDPSTSDILLNRLRNAGLVDDHAFANAWVSSRRLLKPISKRRLIQELRQKRIDSEIIDEVLAQDETDELTVVQSIVAKKRQQTRYQDNLKLMQYLSRQGFNYDTIKQALSLEEPN